METPLIFSKTHPFLSNYSNHAFKYEGKYFPSLAHFLAWSKAIYLEEYQMADDILQNPDDLTFYEEELDGENTGIWERKLPEVLLEGLTLKFDAHPDLKLALLKTENIPLGYTPSRIMGIGLRRSDSFNKDLKKWKGRNLLGNALMRVRHIYQYPKEDLSDTD